MPESRDLYEILGVDFEADGDAIRAAYIAAAKRSHPDTRSATADDEAMRAVNLAYEVLGDATSRARYDAEHRGRGFTLEEIGEEFGVSDLEPDFTDLPRYKLAALNREIVVLEAEGWHVERRYDHLICTRPTGRRWWSFERTRDERMSVSIDADGLVHRTHL